jgi:hypothetical protein
MGFLCVASGINLFDSFDNLIIYREAVDFIRTETPPRAGFCFWGLAATFRIASPCPPEADAVYNQPLNQRHPEFISGSIQSSLWVQMLNQVQHDGSFQHKFSMTVAWWQCQQRDWGKAVAWCHREQRR